MKSTDLFGNPKISHLNPRILSKSVDFIKIFAFPSKSLDFIYQKYTLVLDLSSSMVFPKKDQKVFPVSWDLTSGTDYGNQLSTAAKKVYTAHSEI